MRSLAAALQLVVLLAVSHTPRHASAQDLLGLQRASLWLPPQATVEPETAARELAALRAKLPQLQPGSAAEQQLLLLAPTSRSKLNALTGAADAVSSAVVGFD